LPQGIHENNHDYNLIDTLTAGYTGSSGGLGGPGVLLFKNYYHHGLLFQRSSTIYNNDFIFYLPLSDVYSRVLRLWTRPTLTLRFDASGLLSSTQYKKMILMIARTIVPRIAMLPMFSVTLQTRCHERPPTQPANRLGYDFLTVNPFRAQLSFDLLSRDVFLTV
jgi:hypothetical protein